MNEELRAEILRMFIEDQTAVQALLAEAETHREAFERRGQPVEAPWPYSLLEWQPIEAAPAVVVRVVQTVADNVARLRQIVAEHGWPGRGAVGEDAADAAWTLLRHAGSGVPTIGTPEHIQFQRDCLPLLEAGVDSRDVHPRQYAAIADFLRRLEGLVPNYAVQPEDYEVVDGAPRFRAPVDLAELDRNRASTGLPPLAEDVQRRANGERLSYSWSGQPASR